MTTQCWKHSRMPWVWPSMETWHWLHDNRGNISCKSGVNFHLYWRYCIAYSYITLYIRMTTFVPNPDYSSAARHLGGNYWDYSPGILSTSQVVTTSLEIGHPWMQSKMVNLQMSCRDLTAYDIRGYRMITSSNGNIFPVTGPLCGEFTGHQWFPLTKASDAELWYFLWSTPEQKVE